MSTPAEKETGPPRSGSTIPAVIRPASAPAVCLLASLAFLATFTGVPLRAQQPPPPSLFARAAWSNLQAPDMPPFSSRQATDRQIRGKKSPWTAVGLSALLPGAGQVYTENYWKIPVIWGLGGYWVYEWIRNNDRYRDFRGEYGESVVALPPYGDERLLRLREFYRDQRDSFTWYLGLLYFLNLVDAYVGAQLYDFDVGPDLGPGYSGVHASLRIRF